MVFRAKSPHQVMDEVGLRKRSKFLILLLVAVFVGMAYYLMTSSKQNNLLTEKNNKLKLRLGKYVSGFEQCERNLKTARSDVKNFHEANKMLQTKLMKQENELAHLEKNHLATESKLQDAFNFFLEVKELVGNDQTVPQDHEVTDSLAAPLKKDITALKMSHKAHGKLQEEHKTVLLRYEAAKGALAQLETEKTEADRRLSVLNRDIHLVQRDLNLKKMSIRKLNESNADLKDTVDKLKMLIKKVKLDAKKAKQASRQRSVVAVVRTPSPLERRDGGVGLKPVDIGPVRKSPRFGGRMEEESLERRVVEHQHNTHVEQVENSVVSEERLAPKINKLA